LEEEDRKIKPFRFLEPKLTKVDFLVKEKIRPPISPRGHAYESERLKTPEMRPLEARISLCDRTENPFGIPGLFFWLWIPLQ